MMFDLAAFDAEIARKNRIGRIADDVHLAQYLRVPAEEGVTKLGATSAVVFAVIFGVIQGGPLIFSSPQQSSASLAPSGLETYAMHLDAPQADHDLISLFDRLNQS